MADQRTKLAKYFNQRVWFSATFEKFTHKKIRAGGFSPVLLLVDLQLTDKKGKTVEPDIADHVWVAANKEVFKLGKELFDGDEIVFSAVVKTYGIKRNDVQTKELISRKKSIKLITKFFKITVKIIWIGRMIGSKWLVGIRN